MQPYAGTRYSITAFTRDGCVESPPPTAVLGELQSYGFAAPTDWAIKVWSAAICRHPFCLKVPRHASGLRRQGLVDCSIIQVRRGSRARATRGDAGAGHHSADQGLRIGGADRRGRVSPRVVEAERDFISLPGTVGTPHAERSGEFGRAGPCVLASFERGQCQAAAAPGDQG